MAKFCKNCGTELKEGKVCQNCGTVNEGATVKETKTASSSSSSSTATNQTVNTTTTNNGSNGLAIAGFVLSLVGLFCCGFTSVLGLIFSIIGLVNANKENSNNKGLAIAGIIISAFVIFLYIILYFFGIIGAGILESYNY